MIDKGTSEALTAFNGAQRAAAASILSYASSVTGIRFVETASGSTADFHFGAIDIAGSTTSGLTNSHSNYSYSGQEVASYTAESYIYLDNVEFAGNNATPSAGSEGYETLLHEIGHALGLRHPFDGTYHLPAAEDNTNNTVMSYTETGARKSTFQAYDLLALTWIYGNDGLGGQYGYNSSYGSSLSLSGAIAVTGKHFVGTAGNDTLIGTNGNDTFEGGNGTDTAIFNGTRANHTIAKASTGWTVSSSAEGTDALSNVERLTFSDGTLAIDNGQWQTAGEAYRLYQAAFARTPDAGGLKYWVDQMDRGQNVEQVAYNFIASAEFQSMYGISPSHVQEVTAFYQNVLGRAPDRGGLDYWKGLLDKGQVTEAQVLINFSESAENVALVGTVIQNGIWLGS